MPTDTPLERLRRLCLALPEVTERLSHGEPTWFVRGKKTFVMFSDHHHDDRLAFVCAAPDGAQEMLVANDPERFFRPPYVVSSGEPWRNAMLTTFSILALLAGPAAPVERDIPYVPGGGHAQQLDL